VAGVQDGTDPYKVTITLPARTNVTCTYVNTQDLYDVVVLTCMDDGELVASSISLDDGTAQNTTTTADTTLGVTEAQLCALADFSDATGGEHAIDLDIDNPVP